MFREIPNLYTKKERRKLFWARLFGKRFQNRDGVCTVKGYKFRGNYYITHVDMNNYVMLHPTEQSVFRDGFRFSWKNLVMPDGKSFTSFYHYPTRQDAIASATQSWNEYTGENLPVVYHTDVKKEG
jgi:hypothetical protein